MHRCADAQIGWTPAQWWSQDVWGAGANTTTKGTSCMQWSTSALGEPSWNETYSRAPLKRSGVITSAFNLYVKAFSAAYHQGALRIALNIWHWRHLYVESLVETPLEVLFGLLQEVKTENAVSSKSSVFWGQGNRARDAFHIWGRAPCSGLHLMGALYDWSLWKRCGISHLPFLWTLPMADPPSFVFWDMCVPPLSVQI